ncbi:MAG: hypothetical protein R3F49_13955 [Planctomycetota bacterium]
MMGDYRYLAGTARGAELALSCFDGAHAFLFRARLGDDGRLVGDFWSGASWHQAWSAERDPAAALPDAFTLCRADPAVRLADIELQSLAGEMSSLGPAPGRATPAAPPGRGARTVARCGRADARELREAYGPRQPEVIGLAFEAGDDPAAKRARVLDYTRARGADWPIFLAGPPDKRAARAAFPVLDQVHAYPTTLFVDAEGVVRAVYTGFSGPATGAAHEELKRAFRAQVERLLGE